MSNPVTNYNKYLEELESTSEALADANGLRGRDSILRDSNDRPLALGGANTNAIAHTLGSAYLAYDYSPIEAATLGFARELKSYWLSSERPAAWDTFKDLYNNQAGRNIAEYARSNNLSRDQIQDLILDALSSGKLIVTQQDPRIDSSFNGNPANFSVPTGDGAPWTSPSKGFSDFARTVTRVPMASPNKPEGSMPRPADNGIGYPRSGATLPPPTPEPPKFQGSALPYAGEYDQYQRQLNGNKPQAPLFDLSDPPPLFAPPNYSTALGNSSVERWIDSLTGIDPQAPTQPALPPFNPYSIR